jgi:hypothetical protein
MKGFTNVNTNDLQTGGWVKPPYRTGKVATMSRAAPKGMDGNSKALTNNAQYGVGGIDGPDKETSMGRSTKKSAGGAGKSSLPPNTGMYGVGGVGDSPSMECYGVSGVPGGGGQGGKRSSLRGAGETR